MQTFLPYESFVESARVLDWKRLGKQRVEAYQILNIITGIDKNSRWRNHPAVLMWEGHEILLKQYINIILNEWICRGYINNMKGYFVNEAKITIPNWMGNEEFHKSHRMNLLRKDYNHYSKFFRETEKHSIDEIYNWQYVWPVRKTKSIKV